MISILSNVKNFWQLITNPTSELKKARGEGRPFYIIITLILGVVSILVASNSPKLQASFPLLCFIVVMLLHISLHWLSSFSLIDLKFNIAYLSIQGVLGLSAVLISGAPEMALAIFATMIGEIIGMFGISRFTIFSVIIFLILTPLSYLLIGGIELLNSWLSPILSTMTILIAFMALFHRQVETSAQAHALAEELEIANRQLTEYATQVENLTLTAERQRMARELHDTLAQGVAGLVLQLEAMKAHLSVGREGRVTEIIDQSLSRARSTLADLRAAIDDLRAVPVNLPDAVREKIGRFTKATGVPCELSFSLDGYEPASKINDHLLRVLSEALANITRHAQASQIWVILQVEGKQLLLEICDNGQGFEPEKAAKAGHYGLLGMRERARLINGSLSIDSKPGQGTSIRLEFPISKEA